MNYHEKYKSFYSEQKWKNLRNQVFVDSNGLCQMCLKKNIVSEGKEVHHIIPIDIDWSKRYDYKNLVLLCDECHRFVHNRSSPLQEFNQFWENLKGGK